ncbi:MAG: hypothetical protein IJP48_02080 [Synergistaceae bacterium]|nr:hypothetical protein [Synergistaceae bacterium]
MAGIKRLPNETNDEYWERVHTIIDEHTSQETRDLIDSLTGILSADYDLDKVKMERLREKYAFAN